MQQVAFYKEQKEAEKQVQNIEHKIYHNFFSGKDKVEDLNFQELFMRFLGRLEGRGFNVEGILDVYH